jgi:hypothetical protein
MKMAILPKAIDMFYAIHIKIPMMFITYIEKSTLKFIWKHKRHAQIVMAILSKRSNTRGITIPNFKLYFRAMAIKRTDKTASSTTVARIIGYLPAKN